MCLRLQFWFPGRGYGFVRRFIIIFTILGICLAVSLAAPFNSAQIVVITGASGVFLSCYLIPVINHIMLYCGWCAPNYFSIACLSSTSPLRCIRCPAVAHSGHACSDLGHLLLVSGNCRLA